MMMKEESNAWARACDTCRSAACAVYCREDSLYLCAGCDARAHAGSRARHERVWVCEACERAPAAFICKADAASLCASCDADVHDANPLARRHHRVPVLPISVDDRSGPAAAEDENDNEDEDEDEAASWLLLPNPPKAGKGGAAQPGTGGFLFGGSEVDEYLDLMEYNTLGETNHFSHDQFLQLYGAPQNKMMIGGAGGGYGGAGGGDSVVPCGDQLARKGHVAMMEHQLQSQQGFQLGLDFDHSPKGGYSYNGSLSHSVSVSSMDVSVVPDSAAMSEMSMSMSQPRPPKGTIDLFSGPAVQTPAQLTPMDREARVLRYREKKKMRKFEKTIRYASRKAYAETRPRIKGRFAKRTDVEVEVDQMFSTALMADTGYGIVPSF